MPLPTWAVLPRADISLPCRGEASLKEGEASPEEGGRPRLERGEGEVSTEEGKRRRLEGRGTPGTEGGLDHTETTLH